VEAYLAMGAVIAVPPDPHLLDLEPDDVHLVLPVACCCVGNVRPATRE
jgi:hypothetical protein